MHFFDKTLSFKHELFLKSAGKLFYRERVRYINSVLISSLGIFTVKLFNTDHNRDDFSKLPQQLLTQPHSIFHSSSATPASRIAPVWI